MSIEPFTNYNLIRQIQRQSSSLQKLSECGPDCQRTRHINRLRDERTRAQQNLNNAPGNFERANKDYVLAQHGQQYYTQELENKYKKEANEIVKGYDQYINPIFTTIETILNHLKSQLVYKKNIQFVYDSYKEKHNTLKKQVADTKGKKNVENRLATFYNKSTTFSNGILYYIKYIYWICVIAVIGLFIKNKQYGDVKAWPFIILILLSPVIFEKGFSFRIPRVNKDIRFRSIMDYVYETFQHYRIDNIYFIFFVLIVGLIFVFSYLSKLPFNNISDTE